MNARFRIAVVLSCLPLSAHAETMVTSHYRASAPHVAAHRSLPIGTRLMITNPRTGRSAQIAIKDRGPFIRGARSTFQTPSPANSASERAAFYGSQLKLSGNDGAHDE